MKNLTKVILESKEKNLYLKQKVLIAMIASIFSVFFSLSIVFELYNIVNGVVLIVLTIFVVLFLIYNEKIKVKSIKSFYHGNKRSLVSFSITFLISIILSSIGVYLWTNKTFDQKIKTSENKVDKILIIEQKYNDQINQLRDKKFSETEIYSEIKESIDYWKTRRAADVNERKDIRDKIQETENQLFLAKNTFTNEIENSIKKLENLKSIEIDKVETVTSNEFKKINSQNNITIIFLVMIFITEIGIIILNKELVNVEKEIEILTNTHKAKRYLEVRTILMSMFLTKTVDNYTSIHHAYNSPSLNKLIMDDKKKKSFVKSSYNLFINLGIIDKGSRVKLKGQPISLVNKFLMDEKEALATLDHYYDKMLNLML